MEQSKDKWFVKYRSEHSTALRLICLPYAGGSISTYANWINEVPEGVEIIAVQPPGRGVRFIEPPFDSMHALVESLFSALTPILTEPYVVFGHSLGSWVSYELLKKIQKNNLTLPVHFFASGARAPHIEKKKENIHALPDEQFKERLKKLNGTPQSIIENHELMDFLMPVLRADFKIANDYCAAFDEVGCSVTVIGGNNDTEISIEELHAWKTLFTEPTEIEIVEGDHFFVDNNVQQTLSIVNSKLSVLLNQIKSLVL
jgi:surfactin synthase thioesterase subunit